MSCVNVGISLSETCLLNTFLEDSYGYRQNKSALYAFWKAREDVSGYNIRNIFVNSQKSQGKKIVKLPLFSDKPSIVLATPAL